ncbi:MAG: DNA cytosine methyltransferase [Bacillota bacterium]|nr:DNA cytosine methyltransferase [Bacillota bacterium]
MNFINQPKFNRYERSDICQTLKVGGDVPLCEVRACLTPDRIEKRQNGRRFKKPGEPMFTLTKQDIHGVAIVQTPRGNNEGGLHDIAPTLTKNSWEHNNHLVSKCRIRKLTPKECWRLQGVPDEITDKVMAAGISDTQMYRGAGDACTVNVIYEIAKKLT